MVAGYAAIYRKEQKEEEKKKKTRQINFYFVLDCQAYPSRLNLSLEIWHYTGGKLFTYICIYTFRYILLKSSCAYGNSLEYMHNDCMSLKHE